MCGRLSSSWQKPFTPMLSHANDLLESGVSGLLTHRNTLYQTESGHNTLLRE